MSRKIIAFCAVLVLILTCTVTAFADYYFDPSRTGSVSVTLVEKNRNEYVANAELSVYYVATVTVNSYNKLAYSYTSDFNSLGVKIGSEGFTEKLDAFVSQEELPCIKMTTDAEGTAKCEGLALGLYFVKQTGTVEGFAPCAPFLVTVPSTVDGEYVYEVNASPKTEVARLTSITIKKEWNTDATTEAAESVTVALLKNETVIRTAVLNAENGWQITFDDMPESDAYSVKELDVPKSFIATYKQDGYVFTVINTSTLIQTGQLVWPIPVLAACGMLLIAAGIVLLHRKRETNG